MSYQVRQSAISGASYVHWTGEPTLYQQLPVYWDKVADTEIMVPKAYWLPPEQQQTISKLKLHGIAVDVLSKPTGVTAQQLQLEQYQFADTPFESRFMLQQARFSRVNGKFNLTPGWVKVNTDQPLGRLAVALLEPTAPDSFFSWGFFPGMFERTEYFEPYAIEPLIAKMLAEQPGLQQKFEHALAEDDQLRNNPRQRYNWFYRQMPFYDQHYLKYPVLIEQ